MNINEKGLGIIKHFEGLKLEAYLCSAGYLTIGYGHLVRNKEPRTITKEQADVYLKNDIRFVEKKTNSLIEVVTTEYQFSALVSFAFNVGVYALEESTLLRLHNQGKFEQASGQFDRWNKATVKGHLKPLDGLIRRRNAEEALYKNDIKALDAYLKG
jgi:lysozyme